MSQLIGGWYFRFRRRMPSKVDRSYTTPQYTQYIHMRSSLLTFIVLLSKADPRLLPRRLQIVERQLLPVAEVTGQRPLQLLHKPERAWRQLQNIDIYD